jgi:hypothetical protein
MPRKGGAVFILIVFFIISKVIERAIIEGAEQLKLDRNLTSLLARISSLTGITVLQQEDSKNLVAKEK